MIRRVLVLLCLGVLLVSCDKSDDSLVSNDESSHSVRNSRRRAESREDFSDETVALRSILEEALRIESPAARERAIADLAWSAIETDPDLASEAFQQLAADSLERVRLIQHFAMRLAEQSLEEALAWADSLESDLEVAAAKGQIALAIAETDPLRAAELLSESGIDGREFDVVLVQVVHRWAAQAPSEAASWVARFPQGEAREAGIKIIARQWLPFNSAAAFQWFGGLQNEDLRREVARAMQGFILLQPQAVAEKWLQHADAKILAELQQQTEQAIKDVGNDLATPVK